MASFLDRRGRHCSVVCYAINRAFFDGAAQSNVKGGHWFRLRHSPYAPEPRDARCVLRFHHARTPLLSATLGRLARQGRYAG
jgi:hypothetical protein